MQALLRSAARVLRVAALAACAAALISAPARAQVVFFQGTVIDGDGHPVAEATVRVRGQNITLTRKTDTTGRFTFSTLTVGRYELEVSKGDLHVEEAVELASAGLSLTVTLAPLKTIHQVVVSRASPVSKRSGTDVTLDAGQLARLPTGSALPSILTQLPSAALGSNGQIHVNGDHNGLNYVIDGVQLPANLNRVLGTEIDPSNIGYLDVLEGAYPAQYGDKFAATLNIGTKANAGPAGYSFTATGGSFNTYQGTFSIHMPLGSQGGAMTFASYLGRNAWGIDPSVPDPVHNASSDANFFLRTTLPVASTDSINLDLVNSLQTFQIPPDTALGVPSQTDDNEYQADTFAALQYRHAIGDHGSIQFGPSFKVSNILDTNDLQNDLAAGGPPPPPGQTNCIDFTDCIFSVYANRTARDYRFNLDYALQSPHHVVRYGGLYDATTVLKDYVITMQPYSALNPYGSFTATDTAPNVAHQQEFYLQDSWTMGNDYELDYGLRSDSFQIFSTDFDQGFAQISPRLKFTRFFGPRASVYAYYGRLFVPFSFENVNPATAAALYYAPPPDTFDLRPQRDSLYELGGHLPVGSADLGIRVMHKVSSNWIDDTQVGSTNLHQDINFPEGEVNVQSLYFQQNLARSGRIYTSVTHSIAVNSLVCSTNLLQNCTLGGYYTYPSAPPVPYYLQPGGGFVAADHDQHWDANAGWLLNDRRGGWFSITGEYGSGLSQGDPATVVPGPPAYAYAANDACATLDAINCKVAPHLIFNAEKGVALGPNLTVALSMLNLLNDRFAITLDNSLQGTHYARPRAIFLQFATHQ